MNQMASNYEYDEDEPMDVDTSSLKTPTPMKPPSLALYQKDNIQLAKEDMISPSQGSNTNPNPNPNRPKLAGSGAKIVKAIRPNGLTPKLVKPSPPVFDNEDDLGRDPFKSRPRIGFDESATSSSSSISDSAPVTIVPSAANNGFTDDWEINHNGCSTSSSSSSSSSSTSSTNKPNNMVISVDTQVNGRLDANQKEAQLSPAASSSAVSSSATDTSSVGSLSPQHGQNDQQQSTQEFSNDLKLNGNEFSNFKNLDLDDNDENARTPTNQTYSSKINSSRGFTTQQVSFDMTETDFNSEQPFNQVQIMVNDQSVNNIFESIFTNEHDFNSFLDVLEKKEINRPEQAPKYSDFARKSLFLPFDLLLQNKNLTPDNYRRLSVIRDKQAEIKSFLHKNDQTEAIAETSSVNPSRLEDHLEEEPTTSVDQATEFDASQQQALHNSIFFDSIFSNDQEFQMFLDVLEKKEVNDCELKKSPSKYSEFARKSLYVLFDPIIEKDQSITPDKAQRLNHLREKQEVIKAFLSEIEEESVDNVSDERAVDQEEVGKVTVTNRLGKSMEPESADKTVVGDIDEERLLSEKRAESSNELNVSAVSSKRDSLSNSHSFDATSKHNESSSHLATTPNGVVSNQGNNSILDLDKLSISKSPMVDDLVDSGDLALGKPASSLTNTAATSRTNSSSLEANANALKARMESIKSQNLERRQQQSMTSSQINSLAGDDESTQAHITNSNQDGMIAKLQAELQTYKDREKGYLEHIEQIEEENEKFQLIAVEFEQIFHQLIMDKDASEAKYRQEIIELTKERDHLQEDVVGIERSFDDLHRRFDNLKSKVVEFRKNEESLQKAIETYQQQLEKEKLKYSTLKKHAEEKLDAANIEIDKLRKSTGIELQTLKAELKRAEIKIGSLELNVQQKDQENSQLTSLLEELLNKVKPNN